MLPDLEDPITSDAITADYRILQRKLGHRYSLDDVATAWEAVHARPDAARAIDLGTGIGSVLLMVAWKLQHARIEAIEAQEVSFRLLAQNVVNNGLSDRVRIHHGDLRDRLPFAEKADLVTGTPPYLPPGTATEALDGQRAHARIELRGGVEAYCAAAAACLAPGGAFVICADARTPERTEAAGRAAGLHPQAKRDVIPRAGKGPLFTLHTFVRAEEGPENSAIEILDPVYVRDAKSELTEQSYALRETFGLGRRARQPQES